MSQKQPKEPKRTSVRTQLSRREEALLKLAALIREIPEATVSEPGEGAPASERLITTWCLANIQEGEQTWQFALHVNGRGQSVAQMLGPFGSTSRAASDDMKVIQRWVKLRARASDVEARRRIPNSTVRCANINSTEISMVPYGGARGMRGEVRAVAGLCPHWRIAPDQNLPSGNGICLLMQIDDICGMKDGVELMLHDLIRPSSCPGQPGNHSNEPEDSEAEIEV